MVASLVGSEFESYNVAWAFGEVKHLMMVMKLQYDNTPIWLITTLE